MTGRPSPHEPASAPSRNALVAFFGEIGRISLERRHLQDQAALATRPDLERRGMLPKTQAMATALEDDDASAGDRLGGFSDDCRD